MIFSPTYLYIKQHTKTGKLYFGKTIQDPIKYKGSGLLWNSHLSYHGKEHIVTLWYQLYDNVFDLVADALSMSHKLDIVNNKSWLNLIPENGLGVAFNENLSNEYYFILPCGTITDKKYTNKEFANLHSLNCKSMCNTFRKGFLYFGFGRVGCKNLPKQKQIISEERKQRLRDLNLGKTKSYETRKKISEKTRGGNNPMYGRVGILNPKYGKRGKSPSKQTIDKISRNQSKLYTVKVFNIIYIDLTCRDISILFNVSLQMARKKLNEDGVYKDIKLISIRENSHIPRKFKSMR